MEMRQERNMYNGSRLRPVKQAGSYHSRTTSNWHMFRNYKSNLSFSDSFSFKKSPRKKKKTEEADSLHRNSPFSFSKSCQATKENVDGCGVLKTNSKDDCQDLIFDKENDDLIFEGLTAVMKKAILDNPKVLEFISKVLPTYPGLATIMLPNQVIALYGSWSVIKQARQQLLNLSGLHEQDVSEPSHKDNKSSLGKEESPPVLSPQKYNPHFPAFNKGADMVNQSKSLSKEDGLRNSIFSSSSSSTAASSSSQNQKNCDKTSSTAPIRINSSDSDFSLPSPVADPAEELDISAVVFHTTPLESVARTGPFTSAVNGSVDSDTDSENLSTTSSQVTSRPKRSCTAVKASSNVESEEDGAQVDQLDKQKTKNKSVHVMKKRKGLATWIGKSIRGKPHGKQSKLQNSYHTNRLLRKQPGSSVTAKRHDSGGGSEVEEEEEEEEEEEVVVVDDVDDDDGNDDDGNDDDWATCAAASCSLKDRRDVTDIVWLQCEGCDTWWHCLCARLGDLTEDEASSLDFTCTYCLAPKTRQSAKRNKVS